jgi:hypothetical protein
MSTLSICERAQPITEIMNWLKPSFEARIESLYDEFFSNDEQNSYNKLFDLLDQEAIPNEIINQIDDIFVEGCMMMIERSYKCGVEEVLRLKSI